jgi:hypothetical protein
MRSVGSRNSHAPWILIRPPREGGALPVENPRTRGSTSPYVFEFPVLSNTNLSGNVNARAEALVLLNAR